MIIMKKVAAVPVDTEGGKIIDSFNTTDNQTTNALSIRATKEYVDGRFAVITGSIADIPDGEQGSKRIYPPEGFTAANSVVISVMYGETADSDLTPSASDNTYVRASDDMFGWKVFITNNYGSTQTLYYKVTIMKVS